MTVMSLLAMLNWEIGSVLAERGGGWVHPKGANSMAVSGLGFRKAMVGTGWTCCFPPPMHNWAYKPSSHLDGTPFLALKVFQSLDGHCWLKALTN